jgi:hypothetical protein
VRKAGFIDTDEKDWTTYHLESALRKLQGESGVEDWFFDNRTWQCDPDTQFDVVESAFSEWGSDEEEEDKEEEETLCPIPQIFFEAPDDDELQHLSIINEINTDLLFLKWQVSHNTHKGCSSH